jgi:hypothetical protein
MRIHQQQIRREEALRAFSEIPVRRRASRRLLGMRAIAGRIPTHRPFGHDRHAVRRRDARRRRFQPRDVIQSHRRARQRRERSQQRHRDAVGAQEFDRHGRFHRLRIREQQIGVEERARRAFREGVDR